MPGFPFVSPGNWGNVDPQSIQTASLDLATYVIKWLFPVEVVAT